MTNQTDRQEQLILIVDDNPTNLGVLADYLETYDFEIITAVDGEDALETASEALPDLILLDVMMPGIDGFETCRQLKTAEATQDIPVIFMTALASEADKVRGFEVGAVDYVTKPVMQREVLARVNTHLCIRNLNRNLRKQLAELEHAKTALDQSQQQLKEAYAREHERRLLSDTLREVAKIVSSSLEHEKVLDLILSQLEQVVVYHRVSVTLISGNQLVLVGGRNTVGSEVPSYSMPIDQYPLNAAVLAERQPVLLADVTQDDRWRSTSTTDPTRSFINAPLLVQGRPIGLLGVGRNDDIPYNEEDVQTVFAFAMQVAIALENARLVEDIRHANEELAKLNVDKDKFFSIVAHDLKGPFLPLLGNAELLTDMAAASGSTDIAAMSASIHRSAKRVFDLLENLLQWSRMQMGRMEYEPEPLNLHRMVEQTVNLLQETATSKEISLHNEVAPNLQVYADENMLDTIIRNLTNNALKFTTNGGHVMISANQNDKFVEIAVIDSGIGVKPEDLDKLFRIDVPHTTTGTAREQGTGLGLIMCQEMVEINGGRIWVESELGQGTTVKFTIPISDH